MHAGNYSDVSRFQALEAGADRRRCTVRYPDIYRIRIQRFEKITYKNVVSEILLNLLAFPTIYCFRSGILGKLVLACDRPMLLYVEMLPICRTLKEAIRAVTDDTKVCVCRDQWFRETELLLLLVSVSFLYVLVRPQFRVGGQVPIGHYEGK